MEGFDQVYEGTSFMDPCVFVDVSRVNALLEAMERVSGGELRTYLADTDLFAPEMMVPTKVWSYRRVEDACNTMIEQGVTRGLFRPMTHTTLRCLRGNQLPFLGYGRFLARPSVGWENFWTVSASTLEADLLVQPPDPESFVLWESARMTLALEDMPELGVDEAGDFRLNQMDVTGALLRHAIRMKRDVSWRGVVLVHAIDSRRLVVIPLALSF